MKTTILFAVLLASAIFAKPQPGLPFLLIWPTARSTALAGAMTGLADDPDAAFFNPAGLAFQPGIGATASYVNWLPGLIPDLHYAYAACHWSPPKRSVGVDGLAVTLDVGYLNMSDYWVHNYQFPDRPPDAWDGMLGATVSVPASRTVGVGLKAKFVHSSLVPAWVWKSMPDLGIDAGGTGSTWAADVGALWRPSAKFSLGGTVANLSPGITYTSSGEHDRLPSILRLGACWTPINNKYVRVSILPEWDKMLVGMFLDSTGRVPFGRKLELEFHDMWKTLAVEAKCFEVLSVRLGYFEDRTWQRGGLVYEKDDMMYHYTLYDLLTRSSLGELKSIGLCWGIGIGYKDYFRFDVSSDAAIYDFPTSNWRFQLTCNDIGRLLGGRS